MLAPYTSSAAHYSQPPHLHSGERPKIFMHPPSVEYGHLVHQGTPQQHAMTPQHTITPHHAIGPKYETEPLLMTVQGVQHFYPPPQMNSQLLHVSSDYEYANGAVVTPSGAHSGTKRSRQDLNLKEKKRMFKLNDRINQLKDMLDEAGVQTKKNKQSILDNAAHYIEMLRSNLLIAKQKAERAEKQAEVFRAQAQVASSGMEKVVRGVFQKTTTPRVVLDMDMQTVTFNQAFVHFTGQPEPLLKKQLSLRSYLCTDQQQLERLMTRVRETKQSTSAVVKTSVADGHFGTVNLVAAVITDDGGNPTNVEFSLIPIDLPYQPSSVFKPQHDDEAETSAEESVTDGDPKDEIHVDQ